MTHGLPVALKSAQPFLFLLNAEDGSVLICPQSMNKKELNDTLESAVLFFVLSKWWLTLTQTPSLIGVERACSFVSYTLDGEHLWNARVVKTV